LNSNKKQASNKQQAIMGDYYNDDNTSAIPRLSKPVSVMAAGLNADRWAHAATAKHPVLSLQNQTNDPYRDLASVRHVHGSALAMILATERSTALRQAHMHQFHGRVSNAGGTSASASLYGEITQGNDVDLQFEDYLGLPQDRPDMAASSGGGGPHVSALPHHTIMERQLRM
jgi:hypothetical protein